MKRPRFVQRMFPATRLAAMSAAAAFVINGCDRPPASSSAQTPAASSPAASSPAAAPTITLVTLRYEIEGMHCSGCVDAIMDKVAKVPGVQRVSVDLESKSAEVAALRAEDDAAIRAAIERLGYKVRPATSDAPAES